MEKKIRYPVLEKAYERYTKHTKKTTRIRKSEAFPELTISCMTPDMNRCLRQSPIIWENNTTIRTRFWFGCNPAYGFHVAEKWRVSPPQYLLYLINHHWHIQAKIPLPQTIRSIIMWSHASAYLPISSLSFSFCWTVLIALFCGIAIEPKETKETICLFWSLFCLF